MFKLITSTTGLRSLPVCSEDTCTRSTASGCVACVVSCPFDALVIPGFGSTVEPTPVTGGPAALSSAVLAEGAAGLGVADPVADRGMHSAADRGDAEGTGSGVGVANESVQANPLIGMKHATYPKTKQWNAPPKVVYDQCVGCGICAAQCPVGAIDRVGPEPGALVADVVERNRAITTSRSYRKGILKAIAKHEQHTSQAGVLDASVGRSDVTGEARQSGLVAGAVSSMRVAEVQDGWLGRSDAMAEVRQSGLAIRETLQSDLNVARSLPVLPTYVVQLVCDQVEPNRVGAEAIRITCIGAINPETLVACANALERNGRLELVTNDCANCPINAGGDVANVCQRANELYAVSSCVPIGPQSVASSVLIGPQSLGECVPSQPWVQPEEKIAIVQAKPRRFGKLFGKQSHRVSDAAVVSRRDLFAGLVSVSQQTEPPAPVLPRALLLQSMASPALPQLGATGAPCTSCNACIHVCPTRALEVRATDAGGEGGAGLQLVVDPNKCVDCNECIRVCASGALEQSGRSRDGRAHVVLTMPALENCSVCKQELPPGEQSPCSACAASAVIGSSIWDYL